MTRRILCAAAALLLLAGCSRRPEAKPEAKPEARKKVEPVQAPDTYRVRLATTKGDIVVEVQRAWAPRGADQFYTLVRTGFYDGNRFIRVIRGFVAQWGVNGDPSVMKLWRELRIPDDPVKLSNRRGTVTFAKLGANSRSTQVFINLRDNRSLDRDGFAPFGKVVEGMEIADTLYFSYGDGPPRGDGPDQDKIQMQGNEYLDRKFPRLDAITKASIE